MAGGIHTGTAAAWTLGTGYTNLGSADVTNRSSAQESMVISSSTPQAGTFTIASSLEWICAVVTFKAKASPPTSSIDDLDIDTNKNIQNVAVDDGAYFVQYGSEYMVQEYKKKWINNTDNPSFTWKGRTTLSTLISPIYIQIFNINSSAWETLAVINTLPVDIDTQVTVTQTTNVSNYYDTFNTVVFRTYQKVI